MIEPRALDWLLEELCVKFGICLPPGKLTTFRMEPPTDAEAFTAAVFRAEGLDPVTADKRLYRSVRDHIEAALQRSYRRDA